MRRFLILAAFLVACSNNDKVTNKSGDLTASVQVSLMTQAAFPGDSLQITVAGANMSTWRQSWVGLPSVIRMSGINPGANRQIKAAVFFRGDTLLSGSITKDLEASTGLAVNLSLVPLQGIVNFSIPVDIENTLDIKTGKLEVSYGGKKNTTELLGEVPQLYFDPIIVPLEKEVQVRVYLYNSKKQLIFQANETRVLNSSNAQLLIKLESLLSYFDLKINIGKLPEYAGKIKLPLSVSREPAHTGDLLFTELMVRPKSSGNEYKWMEIYNGTLDTLLLDNCKIGQKTTSAVGANSTDFLWGVRIEPGMFAVLGRDSVPFADFYYDNLNLVGTKQSVVLHCNNTVIDSIHYYEAKDSINPFPNPSTNNGKSMQVPLREYAQRLDGSVWCAGTSVIDMGDWKMWGSPGKDANCGN